MRFQLKPVEIRKKSIKTSCTEIKRKNIFVESRQKRNEGRKVELIELTLKQKMGYKHW